MSERGGMRRQRPPALAGAVLLETIVAMAVLASAGLALFAWAQQSLETVSRLQQVDARTRLKLDALAIVESVNPHAEPRGEIVLPALRVSWISEAIREPLPAFESGAALGSGAQAASWRVGLYRLRVDAQPLPPGPDAQSQQFELVRTGWGLPGGAQPEIPGTR